MKISLKAARVNSGLTQEEVAKKMHKSKNTVNSWENGKTEIDRANFEKLCNLYRIKGDYIFLPINNT